VSRPRILLVDDHRIVTQGLMRLLEGDVEVVDSVHDGRAAVDAVILLRPDVVLLDLSMPGLSGLEVMRQLKARGTASRIVVLTMDADGELAVEALKAGASGFLLKESSAEEMLTAIRIVLNGGTYLASSLTRDIMTRLVGTREAPVDLTPQQREVLRLVISGQRAKEIAAALDLSTRTVEAIKYRMMQSLNVHSTAELVRYAVEHRLIAL
jgi:DNA-binding NarL/FixJ family response regulator